MQSKRKGLKSVAEMILQIIIISLSASLNLAKVDDGSISGKGLTRIPKQIQTNPTLVNSEADHKSEESGSMFDSVNAASVGGGHGKYFQYQHVPHKDHYEFGHKRGNEHHFIERHEKAAPHHGIFKTKARWGDKHGGYGEHYWDYNHAGHDHDGGGGGGGGGGGSNDEESHDEDEGDGGYSHHVPEYVAPSQTTKVSPAGSPAAMTPQEISASEERFKRQPTNKKAGTNLLEGPISLVYDLETGTVMNEATGQSYILQPVN